MNLNIVSWNCNGLRSVMGKKAFDNLFSWGNIDILCLQETRCPEDTLIVGIPEELSHRVLVPHDRKGYSGVAVFSKLPFEVVNIPTLEKGRCLCADFKSFYLLNLYVPNSKPDLSALPNRTTVWEPAVRKVVNKLQAKKPVIVVGDFNVGPTELDIYMVKPPKTHGATPTEREDFQKLLSECKLTDIYRKLHPTVREWTWFSNFGNAREQYHGWRIDMFLLSSKLVDYVKSACILRNMPGSDHVPISLELSSKKIKQGI